MVFTWRLNTTNLTWFRTCLSLRSGQYYWIRETSQFTIVEENKSQTLTLFYLSLSLYPSHFVSLHKLWIIVVTTATQAARCHKGSSLYCFSLLSSSRLLLLLFVNERCRPFLGAAHAFTLIVTNLTITRFVIYVGVIIFFSSSAHDCILQLFQAYYFESVLEKSLFHHILEYMELNCFFVSSSC